MYGISIGKTFLHVVGDASVFIKFSKSWASINKFNGISFELLPTFSQPLYDRSVIQDPFKLKQKIFNDITLFKYLDTPRIQNQTSCKDVVRATFVIHRSDIMKLKSLINHNVSAYTVTCAFMWTCLSKSLDDVTMNKIEEDNLEQIQILINCRQRFDSLIPQNYFGNCIVPCVVGLTHGKLIGNEGFVVAATLIGDAIQQMLNESEGILRGDWLTHLDTPPSAVASEKLMITGSAQHDVFNFKEDFGWGELIKHEFVSIYPPGIFMMTTLSRKFKGAPEFGISLPKKRMDAFTDIFTKNINSLSISMKSS